MGAMFVLAAASMGGCEIINPVSASAQEDFEITSEVVDGGSLSIDWINGTVTVVFDENTDEVTITGTRKTFAGTETLADAAIDDILIEYLVAESYPPQLYLKMTVPAGTFISYSADVKVVLPAGLDLTVTSANGSVEVAGNTGETRIALSNGDIVITDQEGDVETLLSNGNTEIVSTDGDVKVRVSNGSVDVEASPEANGTIDVVADVGSVDVRVPSTFAAALTLSVNVGLIELADDLADFVVTDLTQSLREITATLNGGGGTIEVATSVGNANFGAITN